MKISEKTIQGQFWFPHRLRYGYPFLLSLSDVHVMLEGLYPTPICPPDSIYFPRLCHQRKKKRKTSHRNSATNKNSKTSETHTYFTFPQEPKFPRILTTQTKTFQITIKFCRIYKNNTNMQKSI